MQIHGTAASDRGRKRQSNEDAFFADDALGLYVVCDGMGGHQAGEVASVLATEAVVDIVRAWRSEQAGESTADPSPATLLETVQAAVAHACRVVHRAATDDLSRAGMGCTLTMLLVAGRRAVMGHVGDTRLYLLREGRLHQLSHDHTMAADLARTGAIAKEEVKTHQLAHVLTRCIGGHTAVPVDTLGIDLLPGDRFILCSDGLSDYADIGGDLVEQIEDVALTAIPKILVSYANGCGGHDNVTVVAVDVTRDPATAGPSQRTEDMRQQIRALADAPLFDEDFLAHLLLLIDATDVREYLAGEVVITRGKRNDRLYLPLTGTLRLTAPDGQVRDVGRGGVIGATMLLRPRPALATVVAREPCRVLLVDAEGLRDLIRKHPFFGVDVLERLGAYLSQELDDCRRTSPDQVEL